MAPPSAASASSSSSSSSRHRHRSARPSRDQLKRHLELLASLSAPLPPELPSPPPSRSASPVAGSKRKLDLQPPAESSKRPRFSDLPEKPRRNPIAPVHSLRSEPEEGELRDEPPSPALASSRQPPTQPQPQSTPLPSASSHSLPIPRPRKKLHRNDPSFEDLKARYHKYGRMLKYSGDARYWSSYPSTHKGYKPLPHPPPQSSPYHQQSALMARLELVDALVCFTYSLWLTDWTKENCLPSSWATIENFLGWTKNKWQNDNASEREKAFLGLIWMMEAFIHSRRVVYMNRFQVEDEIKAHLDKARGLVEAATPNPSAGVTPASSQPTPPMLPSPESIAPAHSANSTPTGRPTGTPNPNAPPPPSSHAQSHPQPQMQTRPPPRPFAHGALHPLASTITVPITASFTHTLNSLSSGLSCAAYAMKMAQCHLTLRTLAAHFPVTFTRVVHSTMRQEDECEPDIEDEDGELFWPGAPATGEGLGWVCLMGKAMIKEYGKAVGYLGYDGVVPKPEASTGSARPDRR